MARKEGGALSTMGLGGGKSVCEPLCDTPEDFQAKNVTPCVSVETYAATYLFLAVPFVLGGTGNAKSHKNQIHQLKLEWRIWLRGETICKHGKISNLRGISGGYIPKCGVQLTQFVPNLPLHRAPSKRILPLPSVW